MSCVSTIPPALIYVHVPWVLTLCNWAIKEKCVVVGKDAVSEFGYPCLKESRFTQETARQGKEIIILATSTGKILFRSVKFEWREFWCGIINQRVTHS